MNNATSSSPLLRLHMCCNDELFELGIVLSPSLLSQWAEIIGTPDQTEIVVDAADIVLLKGNINPREIKCTIANQQNFMCPVLHVAHAKRLAQLAYETLQQIDISFNPLLGLRPLLNPPVFAAIRDALEDSGKGQWYWYEYRGNHFFEALKHAARNRYTEIIQLLDPIGRPSVERLRSARWDEELIQYVFSQYREIDLSAAEQVIAAAENKNGRVRL